MEYLLESFKQCSQTDRLHRKRLKYWLASLHVVLHYSALCSTLRRVPSLHKGPTQCLCDCAPLIDGSSNGLARRLIRAAVDRAEATRFLLAQRQHGGDDVGRTWVSEECSNDRPGVGSVHLAHPRGQRREGGCAYGGGTTSYPSNEAAAQGRIRLLCIAAYSC